MHRLICIAALLCSATVANAFPPGDAWELPFAKGDYRKAYAMATPSAEKGNHQAQYFIGYMYLNGPGGKKDYEKAYPYFKKAAKTGNPEAINYFGLYYLYGYGSIKKDVPRGIFCIATAAQKGSADARENLIKAISGSDGSKVLKYLESEADKGNIAAICELGNYYHNELSPESNDDKMTNQDKAEEYYLKGAKRGDAASMMYIGDVWMRRKQLVGDESQEKLKTAINWYQKAYEKGKLEALAKIGDALMEIPAMDLAIECYRLAAAKGSPEALQRLGKHYSDPLIGDINMQIAFSAYEKAAQMNDTHSLRRLVELGRKTKRPEEDLFKWNQRGAELGDHLAMNRLGDCYQWGIGTPKDIQKAVDMYFLAASGPTPTDFNYDKEESGKYSYIWAMYEIGNMYFSGTGLKKDYAKALTCYKKVFDRGSYPEVAYKLGTMCENGCGCKKDIQQAINHYEYGADRGDTNSQLAMARCFIEGTGCKKDYTTAQRYLKSEKFNSDPLGLAYKARILKRTNGTPAAINRYIQAALDYHAPSYFKFAPEEDNTDKALKVILEDNPNSQLALYRCGEYLYSSGNLKGAMAQFEKLRRLLPDDQAVKNYADAITTEFSRQKIQNDKELASENSDAKTKIAVLNLDMSFPVLSQATDLLYAELMKEKGLEVLEREKLSKLLDEQALVFDEKSALSQNALIQADILIIIDRTKDIIGRNFIKMAAFDVKNGLRIFEKDFPFNANVFMNAIRPVIRKTLQKSAEKPAQIFAVYPFTNNDVINKYASGKKCDNDFFQGISKYNDLQNILPVLLRKALLEKGCSIFEFEETRQATDEKNTGTKTQEDTTLNIPAIKGEFTTAENKGKKSLNVSLRMNSSSNQNNEQYNAVIALDENNMPSVKDINKLAEKILSKKADSPSKKQAPPLAAKDMLDAAMKHLKGKDKEVARQEFEAAIFLDSSCAEARRQLIKIYYDWLETSDKDANGGSRTKMPEKYAAYYDQYLGHLEHLAHQKETFPPNCLHYLNANGMRGIPDYNENRDRFYRRTLIICEYILYNGAPTPEIADSALFTFENICSKMELSSKLIPPLFVRCGEKLFSASTPDFKEISMLQDQRIPRTLRDFSYKYIKYSNDAGMTEDPVMPTMPYTDNCKDLEALSAEVTDEMLKTPGEALLKKARESFTGNNFNVARLNYEAFLKGGGKLEREDELNIAVSYRNILFSFPYSAKPTANERDIALKFCERGMNYTELFYSLKSGLPPSRYMRIIATIADFKKIFDLGINFEERSSLSPEQEKRIDVLMKRLATLAEENVIENNFLWRPYKDTYFWLYKDDASRFKKLSSYNQKYGSGSCYNIYEYRNPEKAKEYLLTFMPENRLRIDHLSSMINNYKIRTQIRELVQKEK